MAEKNNTATTPVKLTNLNAAAVSPLKLNVISFVSPALGWVLGHWKLAVFLLLLFINFIQYELIKHYKTEAAADNTTITILTESLTKANKAVTDQNNEIRAAQKEAEDKQAQLDNLSIELVKKHGNDQKTIDALRKKNAGTTCVDALKFMNDYLGTIQWQK